MKDFNDLTKEDLEDLYLKKDLNKSQIADMYGVTLNQVRYKLQKFKINKMHFMLKESIVKTTAELGNKEVLNALFNAYDETCVLEEEIVYGPVIVKSGKYKGRIGFYDDDEGKKLMFIGAVW